MTPILNAVMSGIHDRHVGSASGVLTTMQRGGNALGVAALEVPFFLTLSSAGARGLSQTASYVQAFGAVAFWNVLMLLAVVGLLLLLPDRTSRCVIIPTDARTFAWSLCGCRRGRGWGYGELRRCEYERGNIHQNDRCRTKIDG